MKYLYGIIFCSLLIAMAGKAKGAEIIIREYPDRVEAECDGSMDPKPAPSITPEKKMEQEQLQLKNEERNTRVRNRVDARMEMNRMRVEANQRAIEQRNKEGEEKQRGM